jgi:hypothetical protein
VVVETIRDSSTLGADSSPAGAVASASANRSLREVVRTGGDLKGSRWLALIEGKRAPLATFLRRASRVPLL